MNVLDALRIVPPEGSKSIFPMLLVILLALGPNTALLPPFVIECEVMALVAPYPSRFS
jgi:hypothetical protein